MAVKGVDLSRWNTGLKIADVKKAGCDFAILRAGYTGYGDRSQNKDKEFESYYKEAKKLGFPVGAYWYSCANTKGGGMIEAKYLYEKCLKGKKFEYPIYIDVEESRWQAHNKKGVTDAIIGFCSYLEDKGYYVGVYASLDWFKNKIDTDRLARYTKWLACWSKKKPLFKFTNLDLWQYTDNGHIAGHRVDMNFAYKDFPEIMKRKGKNGYSKATKSIDELAREVIEGKWDNGQARIDKLTKAGYDYKAVQARVNALLK